jgi:hypothetical protein
MRLSFLCFRFILDVVAPSLVGLHAQKETGSFRLDAV